MSDSINKITSAVKHKHEDGDFEEPTGIMKSNVQVSYKWTIEDFAVKTASMKSKESLKSPTFCSVGDSQVAWHLDLFPRGEGAASNGYISIYLCLETSDKEEIAAKFEFKLERKKPVAQLPSSSFNLGLNFNYPQQGDELKASAAFRKQQIPNATFGWAKALFLTVASDKAFGYLSEDGKFVITCNIEYDIVTKYTASKVKALRSTFSNDCHRLYDEMEDSDVEFYVDNHQFKAHKLVLSLRSPVFRAMFQLKMKENKTGRVDVVDMEPKAFEELLRFIYTDQLDLNDVEMASALLAAGDKYQLELLKFKCEEFLSSKLTVENTAQVLLLSDLHSAETLKKHIQDFFWINLAAVKKTEEWQALTESNSKLVITMLESVVIDAFAKFFKISKSS